MKLNHLNLTVSNVLEAHRFLERHFGLKCLGGKPSAAMGFLSDDNGLVLSLFRAAKGTEVKYPPGFHVGFVQESEERVDQINQHCGRMGSRWPSPPAYTARGRFTSKRREDSRSKFCASAWLSQRLRGLKAPQND